VSVSQRSRRIGQLTSGKSTQKAFMFIPYKKLAKLSLNLLRLSCINCRCIKFASRSAIESESSANAGSSKSNGKAEVPDLEVKVWLSRSEVRELGLRGVEGREGALVRVTEVERLMPGRSMFIESER
jgi:hypothetical protein